MKRCERTEAKQSLAVDGQGTGLRGQRQLFLDSKPVIFGILVIIRTKPSEHDVCEVGNNL